jgi:hypothetical protein
MLNFSTCLTLKEDKYVQHNKNLLKNIPPSFSLKEEKYIQHNLDPTKPKSEEMQTSIFNQFQTKYSTIDSVNQNKEDINNNSSNPLTQWNENNLQIYRGNKEEKNTEEGKRISDKTYT